MTLDKKLLIWNGIGNPREDKKIYAEDYYCVRCYQKNIETPGDKFFGLNDPDGTKTPYCNKCIKDLEREYWLHVMNNPLK